MGQKDDRSAKRYNDSANAGHAPGDDGFGEDPTVKQFEALPVMIIGKLVPRILSKRCE
jgi:hypothetical protein